MAPPERDPGRHRALRGGGQRHSAVVSEGGGGRRPRLLTQITATGACCPERLIRMTVARSGQREGFIGGTHTLCNGGFNAELGLEIPPIDT